MIDMVLNRQEVKSYEVKNLEALPRGLNARYLGCIRGQSRSELIAKHWARKLDRVSDCPVVIDFVASVD